MQQQFLQLNLVYYFLDVKSHNLVKLLAEFSELTIKIKN